MNRALPRALGLHLLFYLAFLAATQVREYGYEVLDQAVVWLPTGVALAGLWLLGARAWWVVMAGAMTQRALIGYDLTVSLSAGLGSASEALVGLWLLRRLGFQPRLERLRDVLAITVAAAVAPLASIGCSWLARGVLWSHRDMAFYSGWDGWWRMNALGVLAVVPVALAWLAPPRQHRGLREAAQVAAVALVQALLVATVFVAGPDGVTGIMLVNFSLLVSLYAAVRYGPRGAVTAGSLAAVVIAVGTANGLGPFLAVDEHERHLSLQFLELMMVAMPLVFGALVAERRIAETQRRAAELERLRTDAELAENRSLLEAIHRNANEGLYRSLPDGKLLYANQAFADLFGFASPADVLQADAFALHAHPERRRELMETIARAGFISGVEVEFRRRDGSTFWGQVSSTVARGPDGEVTSYDGAIADVTARRQLEEQLRQSQRLESVGQLAGGIAHDFNNVLTAIVGYAELIRSSVRSQDAVHGYASGVLRASERAAALTRQLLAYSRRQVLSPQVLELGAVVRQLGDMLHRLIGEDIQLRLDIDPRGAWSLVDRSQLEQVIVNLVVNARDAMPEGGELTVAVRAVDAGDHAGEGRGECGHGNGPHIRLDVTDTGVGMDEEVRARAFDPFFTTKARGKGTGLGLSTVYGIVRQSGGDIFLDSNPGRGTTVTVCLPRVAPGEPAPRPAPAPSLGPASATILFAEDEAMVRELTAECLARAGFTVLSAADGQAALEMATAGELDLLVTDVVMPRLGGRELAARLRATHPMLRVLFISGYTDDAGDLRDFGGAGSDFLQKPFSPEALVARVRSLLGAPGALPAPPSA